MDIGVNSIKMNINKIFSFLFFFNLLISLIKLYIDDSQILFFKNQY